MYLKIIIIIRNFSGKILEMLQNVTNKVLFIEKKKKLHYSKTTKFLFYVQNIKIDHITTKLVDKNNV